MLLHDHGAQVVILICHRPEEGVGSSSKDQKMGRAPSYASTVLSQRHSAIIHVARGKRGLGTHFQSELVVHMFNDCPFLTVLLALSVKSVGDHTRMQQFAESGSMIKGQIPKAHTPGQFGKLIKRRGMPASAAETSAWDITCPKHAKIIGLACLLFLPYFLLVQ